jgi:hypothetical protein
MHGNIDADANAQYSAVAVDGRPDLGMIVYNPVTQADADRIRVAVEAHVKKK